MPGMNSGLDVSNPAVVAAFRSALLHQGIAALLIFAVLSVAWVAVRDWRPGEAGAGLAAGAAAAAEPAARRVLRIGFGLLWLLDGLLQAQPGMAVGLPSQVIAPAAAGSPGWVQHLVNWAGTAWSYHPVQAGAAAVWIQVGIGLWLLFAARGPLSRLAGMASVGWGLVVWVFGEALGGVLGPGLSWLTGAPGSAVFYVVAGVLVALPARAWAGPRAGQVLLGGTGVFLAGTAVLQAWPGRGFWAGSVAGQPGSLTSMVQSMAATPQPGALGALASGSAAFIRAHGFGVNLLAVITLALLGAALAGSARPAGRRLARPAVIALVVVSLADWVLVQDFGFFGGLGTDPNSAIPFALLVVGGYLALVRAPDRATAPAAAAVPASDGHGAPGAAPAPGPGPGGGWRQRIRPGTLPGALAATGARTMLSAGAVGVIILGAVPMAAAQASSAASPILAEAIDGSSAPLDSPAPPIALTDQHGAPVSLASLHGKAVLLTFLDPVCVNQCPIEAQEFKQAGVLLGADAGKVELIAVNLNPLYSSTAYTSAFDRAEQLSGVRNWRYLTGSPAQLKPVWREYGQASQTLPAGSMLGHSESAFVIDPSGLMREELSFDPGPGTAATESSFATELAVAARQALGSR